MEKKIRQLLGESQTIGKNLLWFDEINSTNTYAKRIAADGADHGTVVLADFQTAGRGRMERSFQSPRGKGIYLSVLLRPEVPIERLMCVTALAGVAVCNAVEKVSGVRPGLKWPNDPVLGKRKVCGILTELVMTPEGKPVLILGIGINVSQTEGDFSPDVRAIATSISEELGCFVDRCVLTAELLRQLERLDVVLNSGEWSEELQTYRKDCVHLGKRVRLIGPNGQETAMAIDIDEMFGLVVEGEDGQKRTVRTGEISVRGLFGYTE